ncbi:MAG: phosphorylase [Beijerinckiaceae bacterium]|nr:phosphorylase [Beijerinckiaceae bacterium]
MGHVGGKPVLAVVGLKAEAKIAASPNVLCLCGGGQAELLETAIRRAAADLVAAIISFGIAGGLAPDLQPGTLVIANAVVGPTGERYGVDEAWAERLSAKLPFALRGVIAGLDEPASTIEQKEGLHERSGALAVDMESHIAARLAHEFGLPFIALRAVADHAGCLLPPAALVGMKPDGSTDIAAVLRSLARRPTQLPALIQTAAEAGRAMGQLKRSRRLLDDSFEYSAAMT